ncbi:complex I subunit 5 family protein [Cellulomonas bogoriensis]|uniref:NADH dehydrogenase n=1 Tax=Cellulomonas bogoriensis 69B4 = DSM 16987 TaxID=1386082 RepID=A0A0A0BXM7_9CELL|nr:proton-conducting transporter membrane subunit [Cellulomonas bogoriensis]KGM12700.1 NADH dehydrogenase [Cellulomonas bogoriensis 69B4 = DSM 16987]
MADASSLLPLLLVLTALVPTVVIFLLPEPREGARRLVNMTGAVVKVVLVVVLLVGVARGADHEWRHALLPGIDLVLRVDPIPLLFVALSSVLWLTTTVYAIGYLEAGERRSRFFGFFSLCVTATIGIALAGNLVTFLLFYELLTIATYPLVAHQGTGRALRGARAYLAYSVVGGAVLLVGVALLHVLAGPVEFLDYAPLTGLAHTHPYLLTAVFVLLVGGLAVKTAIVPLHGWLPRAMVAPAPVSALLHAVAVVKAGAYGIVRVVHDLYGVALVQRLDLLTPLAVVAAVTILYGSVRALSQDDLKRRLAFSTVSQVSYVVLGVTLVSVAGLAGGLVHLVHQGIQKVTLFYCAGLLAKSAGVTKVSQMSGVGRRMPWTMAAFTVAALGMIGVPPTAGFVTKWYIGTGSLEAGQGWVVLVLLASGALNAAYFLPVLARAWFRSPERDGDAPAPTGLERDPWLLLPTVATGASVLLVGVLAGSPFSPLGWATSISEGVLQP